MPFKECPNYFRPIDIIVLLSCKTTLWDGVAGQGMATSFNCVKNDLAAVFSITIRDYFYC
jgi:hypothetical protein